MKTFAIMIAFLACAVVGVGAMKSQAQQQTPSKNPQYVISVTQGSVKLGDITVELWPSLAPKHVANFDSLVKIKFYDGTAFHRVISGFMIQGGDPNSKTKPQNTWGQGDPSQTMVPAEFNKTSHKRGVLSAARRGDNINSATSQFFICHRDAPHLDGQYTAYGQVVDGLDVVDKIAAVAKNGERPIEKVTMTIVRKQ